MIIKNRTSRIMEFAVLVNQRFRWKKAERLMMDLDRWKKKCRLNKNKTENNRFLLSRNNQKQINVMLETEKISNSLKNVPTDNITELNYLIYDGSNRIKSKIGRPQRNINKYKRCMRNKVRMTKCYIIKVMIFLY